ncbi:MAG TPA: glycosyltransferase [Pirellulales bacterium]|nr:glycosyltransferase [Pirellulales bacterium]
MIGSFKRLLRPAWRAVNPAWVQCWRSIERASIRTKAAPTRWLRRDWPKNRAPFPDAANVAIVTVNYNTAEHIAHLLFSLFRVLGRDQFRRVVVVDNGSTDGSVELLKALAQAGLIEVILNRRQRYHGPALNQAMSYLARQARHSPEAAADYIWVLDSDTIVLRPDGVRDAVERARATGAGLLGQVQYHEMPEGYAHISSLLLDPARVWRRSIAPFYESGTPAEGVHASLRKRGVPIVDFPYRDDNYVLHLGSRTLRTIRQRDDAVNRYYGWACDGNLFSFHDNPAGQVIYDAFTEIFRREVETLDPPSLLAACSKRSPIEIVEVHSVGNALRGVPCGAARHSPAVPGTPQRAFPTGVDGAITGFASRARCEVAP